MGRFLDEHTCQLNQKNAVEFFWLCEATTGFALKGMIYSERESDLVTHKNLANDIVIKLCSVYFGTGRDIYIDRYFTSHGLVCNLMQQNLTLSGTTMANQREVPSQLKAAKRREVKSTKVCVTITKFYFCHMSPNSTKMCL